jgi:uncharacterized protein
MRFILCVLFSLCLIGYVYSQDCGFGKDTCFIKHDTTVCYKAVPQNTIYKIGNCFYMIIEKGPVKSRKIIGFDNKTYKDYYKEGVWEFFHSNGNIRLRTTYKMGIEDGIRETFDDQGNLLDKSYHKVGVLTKDNLEQNYVEQGLEYEVQLDKYGNRNGLYKSFFPNGKVQMEGNYIKGVHFGKWVEYNEEGKTMGISEYASDSDAAITIFYESGEIKIKAKQKNYENAGEVMEYYKSGGIALKGFWFEGKQEGTWLYYNLDGKVIKTKIYKAGKLIDTQF